MYDVCINPNNNISQIFFLDEVKSSLPSVTVGLFGLDGSQRVPHSFQSRLGPNWPTRRTPLNLADKHGECVQG